MAHEKVHVICENLCLEEGMTKEQIEDVFATKTEVEAVASGSPAGIYSSYQDLVDNDPDHSKIYLVSSNGNWYYYGFVTGSGAQWIAGGTYQAAEDSETVNQLEINLNELVNAVADENEQELLYTLTAGRVINASGEIVELSTGYCTTDKIFIGNAIQITLSTAIGFGNLLYAFYDINKNFISGKASSSSGTTTIENEIIMVPDGAKYIAVGSDRWNRNLGLKAFYGYKLKSNLIPRVDVLEEKVEVLTTDKYSEMTLQISNGYYLNSSGILTSTSSGGYKATQYIDISEYDLVKISASGNWSNLLYAFYDNEKNPVSLGTASGNTSTYTIIEDEEVTVPEGAKYLIVCGRSNSVLPVVKYKDGFETIKDWSNKKWVCVGDSLTEINAATTKHYFDYISEKKGNKVFNMGVGGTGYIRGYDNSKAFYQRISQIPDDADFVTVFGSGNDLNIEAMNIFAGKTFDEALGNYTDTETNTICGCVNKFLDNYYLVLPIAPIGIIAPTPWQGYPTTLLTNNRMEKYVEALKQIAEYRGVPFLDLYHCSNLRPEDQTNRNTLFYNSSSLDGNGDGVHPNELGHKIIASKILKFVEQLMI